MSTKRKPWFERDFPRELPGHLLPTVLERLRGTPARITDRLLGVPPSTLCQNDGVAWSIQENVGHLLDLEPLWFARVADLAAQRPELTAADLTNRKTLEANHNQATLESLLNQFREQRSNLVSQVENFPENLIESTALHPRLKHKMNVVDLCYFVAEHDDYHLAKISELLNAAPKN